MLGDKEYLGNGKWAQIITGDVKLAGSIIQQPTDLNSVFTEIVTSSTTNLAANATFTGPTIDMQAGVNGCSRLVSNFSSPQDGELYIEGSLDGTVWSTIATAGVAKMSMIDIRVSLRYVRPCVKNGATLQTKNFIVATRMVI